MRSTGADAEAARTSAAVAGVVEQVFDTVAELQGAALRSRGAARAGPVLEEQVRELLDAPGQLAVGLGLVAVPGGSAVRLQWWQVDPDAGHLRALEPDLDPGSVGYYDCTATEWFDVPRRTGRRHVVGPYVDVHGTGRYLLTLTAPVVLDGGFVGVVGADVPVDRFETHLLRLLGPVQHCFVLLDADGRVVLSTAARWLVGDLVPGRPPSSHPGHLPGRHDDAGIPVPGGAVAAARRPGAGPATARLTRRSGPSEGVLP